MKSIFLFDIYRKAGSSTNSVVYIEKWGDRACWNLEFIGRDRFLYQIALELSIVTWESSEQWIGQHLPYVTILFLRSAPASLKSKLEFVGRSRKLYLRNNLSIVWVQQGGTSLHPWTSLVSLETMEIFLTPVLDILSCICITYTYSRTRKVYRKYARTICDLWQTILYT